MKKLNIQKKITGIYCGGDYKTRPLILNNSSIVINWSYYFLKLEFASNIEEINILLDFYVNTLHYGEWGEVGKKPTSWICVEDENQILLKDKEYIKIEKILNSSKKSKFIKFTIFFETIIKGDILDENYTNSNSYWINCLGGLYDVADLELYLDCENIDGSSTLYKNKILPFNFDDYTKENLHEYSLETAKTARSLIQHSKKWSLFKFEPSIYVQTKN